MNDHFASLTGSDSNTGYSIYIYTRYALKFTMGVRFDEKKNLLHTCTITLV